MAFISVNCYNINRDLAASHNPEKINKTMSSKNFKASMSHNVDYAHGSFIYRLIDPARNENLRKLRKLLDAYANDLLRVDEMKIIISKRDVVDYMLAFNRPSISAPSCSTVRYRDCYDIEGCVDDYKGRDLDDVSSYLYSKIRSRLINGWRLDRAILFFADSDHQISCDFGN